MRPSTFDDKKELRISEDTRRILCILRKYSELYSDIYAFLEMRYGEDVCGQIIDEELYAKYDELDKCLTQFLVRCIKDNLDSDNPGEI